MSTTNEIRAQFLDFFKANDHAVVASSPLVPRNDPSLMFTNAGMVQFKNVFTGQERLAYDRAATSQKCVRAGGKHNDLDNVGYTARHHTFFEMLGNFSFGDYFKDRAIELAWTLVTRDFGLDPARLLVTVYAEDDEAFDLWRKIAGLPEARILRIPTSDNFWSMGETGPCGPCSEIFYDHGDHIPGGPPGTAEEDGDRFVEIWNLVFMQFDQKPGGAREDLPRPSIDTGMGLERIAAVMQGVHDNYDIDLFRSLIESSANLSGAAPDGPHRISHRVIADHLRAACFLMADGVLPSNEGRGYVLRRIMRRAMRHVHLMDCDDPLMHRLVPALVREMGAAFPELARAEALMTETLKLEEDRFRRTLDKGLKILDEETAGLEDGGTFSGETAFRLYDTYGFPLDLTQDALRPRGIAVDLAGFEAAMARQKAEARAAWAGSGESATEALWYEAREIHGATEFLGYETEAADGRIVAIVRDDAFVESAGPGDEVAVIANQTPFYGESGGQLGDAGRIETVDGGRIIVRNTLKKLGDVHVHVGQIDDGPPVIVGRDARFIVDNGIRGGLRRHHSATHLLHAALREILGDHVTQKGSLVAPDRLRFDFSHSKALSDDQLAAIEARVNEQVLDNGEVTTRLMDPGSAIEAGAMALFGEKYGEEVRVVAMGGDGAESGARPFSVELCGGTHVRRTGDIGPFKIVAESAVAAGVRRIEAIAGESALDFLNHRERLLARAAESIRVRPEDLPDRLAVLMEERKKLERELNEARKALASGSGARPVTDQRIAGVTFVPRIIEGLPPRDLKPMADELKAQIGSGVIALITVNEGKASLVVAVTEDLTARFDAVALVRIGAETVGGKGGGGRPDMAQAGGPDGDRAQAAVDAIAAELSRAAA